MEALKSIIIIFLLILVLLQQGSLERLSANNDKMWITTQKCLINGIDAFFKGYSGI